MTQGPPWIVFSKAERIALCRLQHTGVGPVSGTAGRDPQTMSLGLIFSLFFTFCFSELALVLTFYSTHVVAAPTRSLVSGIYTTATHAPPAFLQVQCGGKVKDLFHQVQTYLCIAKEKNWRAVTRH